MASPFQFALKFGPLSKINHKLTENTKQKNKIDSKEMKENVSVRVTYD